MDIHENENWASKCFEILEIIISLGHKVHRKLHVTYFYFTAFIPKTLKQSINSSFFSKEQAILF